MSKVKLLAEAVLTDGVSRQISKMKIIKKTTSMKKNFLVPSLKLKQNSKQKSLKNQIKTQRVSLEKSFNSFLRKTLNKIMYVYIVRNIDPCQT